MSLPAGITTATVTKSPPRDLLGNPGTIKAATVAADRDIVWAATGETLYGTSPITINPVGDALSFALAHVDQAGFLDATTGQAVTGWYYTIRATVKYGSTGTKDEVWRLQATTGTTALDLDLVERQGAVLPAVTAPAPRVLSFLGKTGVITSEDIAAPLVAQLDPITAALLTTPASASATALSTRFAAKPNDAVAALAARKPVYVGHRGGLNRYPQESLEGLRAAARDFGVADVDLRALADGTIVCIHDANPQNNMVGTTATDVATMTFGQWKTARIKPAAAEGAWTTGKPGTPATWDEVLDTFKGTGVVIVAELKPVDDAFANGVIAAVRARDMVGQVIHASNTYGRAQSVAAAGLHAMAITDTQPPAQMVTDRVEFVCPSTNATTAYVSSCVAAGIRAYVWTPNEKANADTWIALGIEGVYSDDPWRTSRRVVPEVVADFGSGVPWPHATKFAAAGQAVAVSPTDAAITFTRSSGSAFASIRMGQFGEGPMTGARIRFDLKFDNNATAQDRWAAVGIGHLPADRPYADTSDGDTNNNLYQCLIRRAGQLQIYARATGASAGSQLTSANAPGPYAADAVTPGGTFTFELAIDATTVTLTCLTDGAVASTANSAIRPTDAAIWFGANGTGAKVTNVRVTRLASA